jgi:Zn-finger nucleic acid-binding protein
MLKFKISGEHQNRVDVCTNCDTAWLDQGEWELLGSLSMQSKLSTILTEPWQRRIREEGISASQQQRFEDILGQHDYKKLMDFKQWIESHPKKQELERILCTKQ